MSFVTPLLGWY